MRRIFVVVPRTVEKDVNWRLFECGRHLIAFDGAVLLLNELWQRKQLGCRTSKSHRNALEGGDWSPG